MRKVLSEGCVSKSPLDLQALSASGCEGLAWGDSAGLWPEGIKSRILSPTQPSSVSPDMDNQGERRCSEPLESPPS